MNTYYLFKKSLKRNWYTQGFNAVPVFLNTSALSGFTMKKILGYGYSSFLLNYKKGYGEMSYLNSNFQRIWSIIKNNLTKKFNYLKQVKKKYEEIFRQHERVFEEINTLSLKDINDDNLLILLKKCANAQTDSIGIAHILDPIGLGIEKEFKKLLFSEILEKSNFNRYYALLTAPSKPSFIAQEDAELESISKLPIKERRKQLEKHLKKYFWIQNSYAGPQKLTIKSFEKRLKSLKKSKEKEQTVPQSKNNLIRKLKLSSKTKEMIKVIDFATIWQDERKRNALKTIGYFGKIIDEVSRRTKISTELLYYLGITDILNLDSIKNLRLLKKDLESRVNGVFFLMQDGKEFKITGSFYNRLIKTQKKITQGAEQKENEIHGSVANVGTAIGRVVVCKDLSSLKKVKNGDVLVTSMTRPEFISTLKKVVAVVTDEGGITSHAAIVARELNIPAVIGTKIATQVLKDGMIVEVKANHGVVKIL